jgi:hypothetical protein
LTHQFAPKRAEPESVSTYEPDMNTHLDNSSWRERARRTGRRANVPASAHSPHGHAERLTSSIVSFKPPVAHATGTAPSHQCEPFRVARAQIGAEQDIVAAAMRCARLLNCGRPTKSRAGACELWAILASEHWLTAQHHDLQNRSSLRYTRRRSR